MNSREKGKRLERELAGLLRSEGFEARRGQQHRGGPGSPDVISPALPGIHFECKGGKQLRLKEFMAQAMAEAPGESLPVVAWKEDRCRWVIIMDAEDWCRVVRESSWCESEGGDS